ncbi:MAG: hypothetical protein ACLP74_00700 [Thermoplasmata archaeon]
MASRRQGLRRRLLLRKPLERYVLSVHPTLGVIGTWQLWEEDLAKNVYAALS